MRAESELATEDPSERQKALVRVSRIAFTGYQRLADTNCNTDGKMIAFLGANEAGNPASPKPTRCARSHPAGRLGA